MRVWREERRRGREGEGGGGEEEEVGEGVEGGREEREGRGGGRLVGWLAGWLVDHVQNGFFEFVTFNVDGMAMCVFLQCG